ncbi:hypothetical protein Tco_0012307 [Tanacetum coccineum]
MILGNINNNVGKLVEVIEDMIIDRWSKEVHKYHVDALYNIHHWEDKTKDFYKAEIGYKSPHKVYSDTRIITYEFTEADLPRLSLNDIEDMYLLKIQGVLHHLKAEVDFINALLLYIRRAVIKNQIKDTQLGVESYQCTMNLTKPTLYITGIDYKIPYTTTGTDKGVVYLNKHNVKSLMLYNEAHKFCDGTLIIVRENL